MRPLFYDDAEMLDSGCDDGMSFTLGGKLLIAGNPKPGGEQPYAACLPKSVGWFDYWTGRPVPAASQPMIKPVHGQLPLFVRAGSIIPRQPRVEHSRDTPQGPLELHIYPGPDCAGDLFHDDGDSLAGPTYRQAVHCAALANGSLAVRFDRGIGRDRPWWKQIEIVVHGANGERRRVVAASRTPMQVTVSAP